ncbi:unnamed protein product [Amoebophrya sp. A120]|nr:unnamed protein product [Amoebophrya sp. A120]|eukprot:GSA120T00013529001.1
MMRYHFVYWWLGFLLQGSMLHGDNYHSHSGRFVHAIVLGKNKKKNKAATNGARRGMNASGRTSSAFVRKNQGVAARSMWSLSLGMSSFGKKNAVAEQDFFSAAAKNAEYAEDEVVDFDFWPSFLATTDHVGAAGEQSSSATATVDHAEHLRPLPTVDQAAQNVRQLLDSSENSMTKNMKYASSSTRSSFSFKQQLEQQAPQEKEKFRDFLNKLMEETDEKIDDKFLHCTLQIGKPTSPLQKELKKLRHEKQEAVQTVTKLQQTYQELNTQQGEIVAKISELNDRMDAEKADFRVKDQDFEKMKEKLETDEVSLEKVLNFLKENRGKGCGGGVGSGGVLPSSAAAAALLATTSSTESSTSSSGTSSSKAGTSTASLRNEGAEIVTLVRNLHTTNTELFHQLFVHQAPDSPEAVAEMLTKQASCGCGPEVGEKGGGNATDAAKTHKNPLCSPILSERAAVLFARQTEHREEFTKERQTAQENHEKELQEIQNLIEAEIEQKEQLGNEMMENTKLLNNAIIEKNAAVKAYDMQLSVVTGEVNGCKETLNELKNIRMCSLRVLRNAVQHSIAETGTAITSSEDAAPAADQQTSGNTNLKPVDCEVSDWTIGSCMDLKTGNKTISCDDSLKGGLQLWSRTVTNEPNKIGKQCPHLEQKVKCAVNKPCPQNCLLSEWTDWATCSSSCKNQVGTQSRTREMLQEPKHENAEPCPTGLVESRSCSGEESCDHDCELDLHWSSWSGCVLPCNQPKGMTINGQNHKNNQESSDDSETPTLPPNFAIRTRGVSKLATGEGKCPKIFDPLRYETMSCSLHKDATTLDSPEVVVPPKCPSASGSKEPGAGAVQCTGAMDLLLAFDLSTPLNAGLDGAKSPEALRKLELLKNFTLELVQTRLGIPLEQKLNLTADIDGLMGDTDLGAGDMLSSSGEDMNFGDSGDVGGMTDGGGGGGPMGDSAAGKASSSPRPAAAAGSRTTTQTAGAATFSAPKTSSSAPSLLRLGVIAYGNGEINTSGQSQAKLVQPFQEAKLARFKVEESVKKLNFFTAGFPNAAQAFSLASAEFERIAEEQAEREEQEGAEDAAASTGGNTGTTGATSFAERKTGSTTARAAALFSSTISSSSKRRSAAAHLSVPGNNGPLASTSPPPPRQKILLLFTDGKTPAIFRKQSVVLAKKLKREQNVRIFVVAVTDGELCSGDEHLLKNQWASFPKEMNYLQIAGGFDKLMISGSAASSGQTEEEQKESAAVDEMVTDQAADASDAEASGGATAGGGDDEATQSDSTSDSSSTSEAEAAEVAGSPEDMMKEEQPAGSGAAAATSGSATQGTGAAQGPQEVAEEDEEPRATNKWLQELTMKLCTNGRKFFVPEAAMQDNASAGGGAVALPEPAAEDEEEGGEVEDPAVAKKRQEDYELLLKTEKSSQQTMQRLGELWQQAAAEDEEE